MADYLQIPKGFIQSLRGKSERELELLAVTLNQKHMGLESKIEDTATNRQTVMWQVLDEMITAIEVEATRREHNCQGVA